MKVVTAEEMREIDRETIEGYGIPGVVLMERAGLAVASKIKEVIGHKRVIVVSGGGNNGGDGLVAARHLHNEGWDVKVFLTVRDENLKGDALFQYNTACKFGLEIHSIEEFLTNPSSFFTRHSVIVDALLGTGLSKKVTGTLSEVIRLLNTSNMPIISVDLPSGISSDNGQVMGDAVNADYTVTFGLPKRGHLLNPGAIHTGRLFVEDIGFPDKLLKSDRLHIELLGEKDVDSLIPERQRYSHKGTYGHVLIIAGSKGKTGAALMAAKACLRCGAGLVTIGIPESLACTFESRVTEEMTLILPDTGNGTLSGKASNSILDFLNEKADILAVGPGIGVSIETVELMKTLIKNSSKPTVVDADGINSLNGGKKIFSKTRAPIILTPHPGEMARLLQQSVVSGQPSASHPAIQDIEKDRINIAMSFAKETGVYLVLKGVPTVIAAPDGKAFINSTGNPGMATAGTGDVLTGMIAGFLGQCITPAQACILGVFLHGIAGDIAASEKGQYSMIAGDIIDKIPAAFYYLRSDG
jgi:hydroxyethylthiazole kinase-like uncharacterized protein yjeF